MSLISDLLFLLISTLLSFLLYPFWIKFVYKYKLGEGIRSDGPGAHLVKSGTPTMGGVVFVLVVGIVTFVLNRSRTQTLFPLFIASIAGLLGLLEDIAKIYMKLGSLSPFGLFFKKLVKFKKKRSGLFKYLVLKPWEKFREFWRILGSSGESGIQTHLKFLFQTVVAGFVAYWVYFKLGWDFIWFPLIGNVHVGLIYPLFIFLFFVATLNSVSFTDGLDGLSGGLSLFSFIAFWVLSRVFGYNSLAIFCATFAGALIPYLYFNVYPARVFMGNVGSHALGAALALLAVLLHREIAFLVIGFVFFVDGISSPLQQASYKLTKKRIFRMAPLHHHFEMMGWPETKVTFRFWLLGIFFSFAGLLLALL